MSIASGVVWMGVGKEEWTRNVANSLLFEAALLVGELPCTTFFCFWTFMEGSGHLDGARRTGGTEEDRTGK